MSNSIAHDQLIPFVCRWLDQQHYSRGCIEPGRPSTYRGGDWPSVDVWAFNPGDPERTVAVDVKVTKADSDAQLHKPYVINPSKGVGFTRYIASPEGLPVTVPDGYGLLAVNDAGEVREVSTAVPYRAQNWRAELHYALRAKLFSEGKAADQGVRKSRGNAERLERLLEGRESLLMAEAKRELDCTAGGVERAVRSSGGRLTFWERWGKREIVRTTTLSA